MKKYTKAELKAKIADSKKKIEQIDHQIEKLQRKEAYLDKKPWQIKRDARTHRIASKGGIVEHFFPETKDPKEDDFYQLVEYFYEYPGVRDTVESEIQKMTAKRNSVVYTPYPQGGSEGCT